MGIKQFGNSLIRVDNVGTDTTPEFRILHSVDHGLLWSREEITVNLEEAEALIELLQMQVERAKQKKEEIEAKLGV